MQMSGTPLWSMEDTGADMDEVKNPFPYPKVDKGWMKSFDIEILSCLLYM